MIMVRGFLALNLGSKPYYRVFKKKSMKINITCDTCHTIHSVDRDDQAPKNAVSMGCNWCPLCEEKAEDYYEEWYNESDEKHPQPEIPDNQLVMPFVLDEIIEPKIIQLNPRKEVYRRILNRLK